MIRSLIDLFLAHQHSREPWTPRQILLGKDRRIFQRVPVNVPCRMDNSLYGMQTSGTAVNLSLGGVGLMADVNWPEGSEVRVFIEALDLQMAGTIVFRKEEQPVSRYGVKFSSMGLLALWRLHRILRNRYQGPLAVK